MDTNDLLSHDELLRAHEVFYVEEDPNKQNILLEACAFLIEFPLTLRFQCAKETNEYY